jgi:hypothetical protein
MRAIRLQASSSLNGLAVEQIDLPVPAGAGDALVHVPALQLLVVAFWRKYDTGVRTPLRFQRAWTWSRVQTVAIRSPRPVRIARPTLRINEFLLTPRADGAPTIPNRNNQAK